MLPSESSSFAAAATSVASDPSTAAAAEASASLHGGVTDDAAVGPDGAQPQPTGKTPKQIISCYSYVCIDIFILILLHIM